MKKALYNLQKFAIWQTKINPETSFYIPNAYAFAWSVDCYPLFDHADYHQDLEDCFKISKQQVDIISKYADDEFLKQSYLTFYQYESHFNLLEGNQNGIDRNTLINVFRYMFLKKMFDEKFWKTLISPMQHPAEARSVTSLFDENDMYLL